MYSCNDEQLFKTKFSPWKQVVIHYINYIFEMLKPNLFLDLELSYLFIFIYLFIYLFIFFFF